MADRNLNFPRSRNGYDPQEVDAVINELNRQIADWKQRYTLLSDTVAQSEVKLRQLAESTKQLQAERVKESLRLTGFFNQAARMAEQTEQEAQHRASEITENARLEAEKLIEDARQEAESIRSQAKTNFMTARMALAKVTENTQSIQKSNEKCIADAAACLAEMNVFITNELNGILAEVPLAAAAPTNPPVSFIPRIPRQDMTEAALPVSGPDTNPYDKFVQELKKNGQHPKYSDGQ